MLSSLYLQVVVEVCHQLLVSSLADTPAVGSENWQKLFLSLWDCSRSGKRFEAAYTLSCGDSSLEWTVEKLFIPSRYLFYEGSSRQR